MYNELISYVCMYSYSIVCTLVLSVSLLIARTVYRITRYTLNNSTVPLARMYSRMPSSGGYRRGRNEERNAHEITARD